VHLTEKKSIKALQRQGKGHKKPQQSKVFGKPFFINIRDVRFVIKRN
jgi:hypothetical protein